METSLRELELEKPCKKLKLWLKKYAQTYRALRTAVKNMQNPDLKKLVEPDNDLKNFIVEYVGERLNPDNNSVTVEMVVETMASEFPEFILAVAEENWIRGYQQGLDDVESGKKIFIEEQNEKKRSCKLCEE